MGVRILRAMVTVAVLGCVLAGALGAGDASDAVFVEAEGFADIGGWAADQQMMDQMGSPYLLAHGLGVPVKDATTTVAFPATGTYRLWVRTRDWVATWDAPGAPGKFQVVIDGKAVEKVFGTEGVKWHWQEGGTVEIASKEVKLALRDLTGFEGRCDAICFTRGEQAPPDGGKALAAYRRTILSLPDKPADAGTFDLVVVGGGVAGTCAAISAARCGLSVALVQNRPVLGGNNSSEVRVHLGGKIKLGPYPALGDIVKELSPAKRGNAGPPERYEDAKKLRVANAQKGLTLFLNTHVYKVEKTGDRIAAVIGKHIRTSREIRFVAPVFADCTGDGTVGFLAGADFRMGREGRKQTDEGLAPDKADKMTMGSSVQWYSRRFDEASPFADCPWAVQFTEANCQRVTGGEWNWETGMNKHQIDQFEEVRDYGMRVVYGNWAYLKNHHSNKAKYANYRLDWMAYIAGKRESRRLLGDVILQQQDIEGRKVFPDACVTTTWTIDLHYPDPRNTKHFPGREFRSIAKHARIQPYPIPYRCFYSRNVSNLFMAGRNVSVTHVALGTVRVMNTTGMMGEVVGMAAAVCKTRSTTPRGVYTDYLDDLKKLMKRGTGKDALPPVPVAPSKSPDISTAKPDLTTPAMVEGAPAAGKRVRGQLAQYKATDVYHALYLPTDWKAGQTDKKYPVIVEYAGNGPYRNKYRDTSNGSVEGSNLGYGLTAGKGAIWLCLPYVNSRDKCNQAQWWGDVAATVAYCKQAVAMVCKDYGGDPKQVVLAGFSRGAIACNYIGLYDDEIAALWRAFIPYSHYDGVTQWGYQASDAASALTRLKRLKNRPQLIVHEGSVAQTEKYVASTGVAGDFTFMTGPFRNHNDRWAHCDTPQRRYARAWLARVLSEDPPPAPSTRRRGAGQPKGIRSVARSKPPAWLASAGKNFALGAKVVVSSNPESNTYPVSNINDGHADLSTASGRWLSSAKPPHTIELVLAKPQALSAARIVSGFVASDGLSAALTDFVLQYQDGTQWKDIPGTKTKGNTINDLGLRFNPVTTSRLRLVVTAAHGGFARLWEFAVYNPPATS